ncbi:DUF2784 domain-containing protein [Nocardiopsis nanhaiensis]
MIYRVIGEGAMVLHMAFLVYVVIGGFIAWRWPRTFWTHLPCAAYALGIAVIGWHCPLTYVEDWGREMAGQSGLPDAGFMEHYLADVIYPAEHELTMRILVGVCVAISWIGLIYFHRKRRTSQARA